MKKIILPLIVVLVLVGIWFGTQKNSTDSSSEMQAATSVTKTGQAETSSSAPETGMPSNPDMDTNSDDSDDEINYEDETPANQKYNSASDALAALKKAAVDYDDLVIQQFVDVSDCAWCDELYASVRELTRDDKLTLDEKSFYAEILSVSNRLDNVQELVKGVEEANSDESKDIMAEALELSIIDDNIVDYLADYMNSDDEVLQEAAVAAISNQGSLKAVTLLFDHTVASGDSEDLYDLGIGPGEVIPDEEALPYLRDKLVQRDDFSHLAAKALVNEGLTGLTMVVDAVSSSDSALDKEMLDGTLDHVTYDEETEAYLVKLAKSSNKDFVKNWAKEVLSEFELEEEFDDDLDS